MTEARRRESALGLHDFVRRLDIDLKPDPSLVVLRAFRPSVEPRGLNSTGPDRIQRIISRVLENSAAECKVELDRVLAGFADRHRSVQTFFLERFEVVARPYLNHRLLTLEQQLLIGAYFAHEYSYQAAALFNPSIVRHPDQSNVPEGTCRFLMSLRAVGEGHISSICFRTGMVDADGGVCLDDRHDHALSSIASVANIGTANDTHVHIQCGKNHPLDESVIFPVTLAQSNGIEDLRLVKFTEDDGAETYFGTYTAYSGAAIASELLQTDDFVNFRLSAMTGGASHNKGMALFPRRIDGRYAMIGRQDNENLWMLYSDDVLSWDGGSVLMKPAFAWEATQIGNCGSPIEVDEGWLVLSHGVGPVRNYSIGAFLLDKHDPSKLLARTPEPIIRPQPAEREGYVPNVVYTCGALEHGRTLVIPYAIADSTTTVATVDVGDLIAAMV